MNLGKQVCSLELAKELKELGVKQESLFYWRKQYSYIEDFEKDVSYGEFGDYWIEFLPKPRYETSNVKSNWKDLQHLNETEYSAFTVAELGEMLPPFAKGELLSPIPFRTLGETSWRVDLDDEGAIITDTEADCRAKMLIYLIRNQLI